MHLINVSLCSDDFFKDAGEVVDVRFASDPDGRFKGFGHVEFATAEAAQKVSFGACLADIVVGTFVNILPVASKSVFGCWNHNTNGYLITVKTVFFCECNFSHIFLTLYEANYYSTIANLQLVELLAIFFCTNGCRNSGAGAGLWGFYFIFFIVLSNHNFSSQAIKLNGHDLLGRTVKLDFARERGAYTPQNRYF